MRKGQSHGMRFAIVGVFRVMRGDNFSAGCPRGRVKKM